MNIPKFLPSSKAFKLPFLKRGAKKEGEAEEKEIKEEPKKEKTALPQPSKTKKGAKPTESLTKGLVSVKDIIAPSAIEIDFNHVKIGNIYFRTIYIIGYPRFVGANWLSPLINFDHTLEIALFHYPVESKDILEDLKRKVAEMEATVSTEAQRGRVIDPGVQIALDDALSLQQQLAKGAERFFQFGLYVTVPAESLDELNTITKQVESTLGSLLIISKHATLQMEEGFKTTLPLCQDHFMITRNMDTTSLATTFPFTSSELTANEGIMYGINEHNGSLIVFDRFTLENANTVVFAKAGAGKSLSRSADVLVKTKQGTEKVKIGQLVDQLIDEKGAVQIDEEMEGVVNPGLEVFTFNQDLKGEWSKVTVAARKDAPNTLYKFQTASGRAVTVTGDHNVLVLEKGRIVAKKSKDIRKGEAVPIPRLLPEPTDSPQNLNLFSLLGNSQAAYIHGASSLIKKHYSQLKQKQISPNYDRYLYEYRQGGSIPIRYFKQVLEVLKIDHFSQPPILATLKVGSRRNRQKGKLPVFLKPTPSLTRFLGYFLSEGTITNSSLLIANNHPKILKDVQKTVNDLGLTCFPIKNGLGIGSRILAELVRALDPGSKAGDKHSPAFIFSLKNELVSPFLKAYFEGDGTVNNHEVSATSKSKQLISDMMYLLLRFGIVARRRKRFKRATNSKHQGDFYHQIVISGQKNLIRFAENVGFVTKEKNNRLQKLLGKKGNTNVDTIPTLGPILEEIYQLLFSPSNIPSPPYLSDLKRGNRHPSKESLGIITRQIENYIDNLDKKIDRNLEHLSGLPALEELIKQGVEDKQLNTLLWAKLGQSWRLAKQQAVETGCKNAFQMASVVRDADYQLLDIKKIVKETFDLMGVSIRQFNPSFRTFLVDRPQSDGSYKTLLKTIDHLRTQAENLKEKIQAAEGLISLLKTHLDSDLFWDPITRIEKITNRDPYVYDLTVDNEVFLAGLGGMFVHNSYMIKLEALRSLMFGTEIIAIDPEAEYQTLCSAIGGQYISFSFKSGAKINPFDLSGVYEEGENELGLKILSLHGLFKVIMGKLTPEEDAILDRALVLTYRTRGITPDPATQKKEPPLMEDLYKVLIGMEQPAAQKLADRIERFIKGSLAGIFDQRSNIDIRNTFTVFSIRDLADELRPTAMYIILDHIWTKIKKDLRKRVLIVDEAWYMMKYPDSALFLYSIAKRSRKYYLGLTTITQDIEDFLNSDYGKAIVTNSSIQILMKQSPAAIDQVAKTFYLSEGEKHLLLSCDVGEGLFFAGPNHVAMRVVASPDEHYLVTTKPSELLKRRGEEKPTSPSSPPKPAPSS